MGQKTIPAVVVLAFLLTACGQKGPLYIPPEQQSPAASPAVPGATTADDLDRELERNKRPPAASQDEQTLEGEEDVEEALEDEVPAD